MAYPALHAYPSFHYYLRDHLGSNRMVVSGDGAVEQANEYYPYGINPWRRSINGKGYNTRLTPF